MTYTAVATTRFKEYFPDSLTANPGIVTRTSQPVTISVKNSARPAAPKPLYVLPAFGWESETEGAWHVQQAIAAAGCASTSTAPGTPREKVNCLAPYCLAAQPLPAPSRATNIPDSYKGYVTQWGKDPIWSAGAPPTQAMPLAGTLPGNAVAVGTELTLDELSNDPSVIPFTVVGHRWPSTRTADGCGTATS